MTTEYRVQDSNSLQKTTGTFFPWNFDYSGTVYSSEKYVGIIYLQSVV